MLLQKAQAQNKTLLDSLQKKYNNPSIPDTTRIIALIEIGNQYRQPKPDTSILIAQQALKKSEKLSFTLGKINAYSLLGASYYRKNDYGQAAQYYQMALAIKGIEKTRTIIVANLNLGNIYHQQGNYPSALQHYQRALQWNEKANSKQNESVILNNIGNIYEALNNDAMALEYYQKSLTIKESLKDKKGLGLTLSNIAIIQKRQNNFQKALESQQKSFLIRQELKDKQGISQNLNNIAEIYLEHFPDSLSTALKYYQDALKIKEEIKDRIGMIYSLNGIASVYEKQQDYKKATEYAGKSLKIAEEIKALKELRNTSRILYRNYQLQGDYARSLEFLELYKQTNDSIFNVERSKVIATLEAKAEVVQKEKEIALLNKNNELLAKDRTLQAIELERQKNAKLALEKEAEASRLFALARQEKDKHKQDSLLLLAQKNQFEADRLKIESQKKALEIQKAHEAYQSQQIINYLIISGLLVTLVFTFLIWRNRRKLKQANNQLFSANEEIKQQKEEILQTLQVVEQQRDEIQDKNENIIASINYARRIQTALLPKNEAISRYLPNFMLFYLPKDIVSGDFYWFAGFESGEALVAIADCTGHGVPGAFMTVIGNNLLDQIVNKDQIQAPALILNELDRRLLETLQQQGIEAEKVNDGMDIALLKINLSQQKIVFAGAKRPIWIFEKDKNEVIEYKGDKFPIGSSQYKEKKFIEQTIPFNKGDILYAFTDGYADQFGEQGKFTIRQFRNFLTEIHTQDFTTQSQTLQTKLNQWKGEHKQMDDILIFALAGV
jgi:serine phosphatase RsbU (regulator of sigma subunit)/tetratricopeptide (TPR) repeat protein